VLDAAGDRVLFAGDSGHTDAFDALGPIKLGVFGIGAYRPWIDAHADPEQVMAMARAAGVQWLLPVHHSTFRLSDEPMGEPMERLLAAAGKQSTAASESLATDASPARIGPALVSPGVGQVIAIRRWGESD
jgi:L-ascorbate metabolism protein UlaG (beta-lactamase superfamily)